MRRFNSIRTERGLRATGASLRRRRFSGQRRRGMAPLELIMVLPVILGFLIAILWLGVAMNTQAVVVVKARHDAWDKRHDGAPDDALKFSSDQAVDVTASQKIQFMERFQGISDAKSRHVVLGGAWDYRQLPLNSQPNWKVYPRLVIDGADDALQTAIDTITGLFDNLPDVSKMINDELAAMMGMGQQMQSDQNSYVEQGKQAVDAAKQKLQDMVDELQMKIDTLNATIDGNQTALDDKQKLLGTNKEKLKDPNLPAADKTKLEAENKRLDGEIKSLQDALTRDRKDRDAKQKKQTAVDKLKNTP